MTGTFPAPAEGLPPCIRRLAILEGNQACWHDMAQCPQPIPTAAQHVITAGRRDGLRNGNDCTNGAVEMIAVPGFLVEGTDDPAEAQAAFERGAEWVRTGEGP